MRIRGYAHQPTLDQIRSYKKLSLRDKLSGLERAVRFSDKLMWGGVPARRNLIPCLEE